MRKMELNDMFSLLQRYEPFVIMTENPELQYIHKNIHNKLDVFIKNRKIPNIIFYGPHGSGKTFILNRFIHSIYDGDKTAIKTTS